MCMDTWRWRDIAYMERLALEGVSRVISVGFQNGFQRGRPFCPAEMNSGLAFIQER